MEAVTDTGLRRAPDHGTAARRGNADGVINLVHGDGIAVSDVALADPRLAGIHFTGSTATFQHLWREVGANIDRYHSYPRLVGETGGKDFIVAHRSADPDVLRTALIRGAFEYQGRSARPPPALHPALGVGSDGRRLPHRGQRIDLRRRPRPRQLRRRRHRSARLRQARRGHRSRQDRAHDDGGRRWTLRRLGSYFVRPTVLLGDDPTDEAFATEYFGPILAVHVYPDADYPNILRMVDSSAKYALTGSIIASDGAAVATASDVLRNAAGNFYINDKPTGAVVGQQPFGGGRASGTNDKAGSKANLMRWSSTRTIKETFVPPTSSAYPHMEQ